MTTKKPPVPVIVFARDEVPLLSRLREHTEIAEVIYRNITCKDTDLPIYIYMVPLIFIWLPDYPNAGEIKGLSTFLRTKYGQNCYIVLLTQELSLIEKLFFGLYWGYQYDRYILVRDFPRGLRQAIRETRNILK